MAPVASTSCSTASANRSGSSSRLLAERVQEHGLERGHVARHVGRARLAAAARSAASDAARSACSFVRSYGSPSPSAIAFDDAADQLGQLPRDLLGRELADLVERRTLDQADEPRLRKLVTRALEAREGSPNRRHSGRSYLWKRRTAGDISEKIAPVSDLITIDEARRRVLAAVTRLGDEPVTLRQALGRVLAEEVSSTLPVPPFDSSAMDGFAVVAGPAAELSVVGEARAGHPLRAWCRRVTAVRISTGAVVPEGADAVVPVERTTAVKEAVSRAGQPRSGDNVRLAGEDIPLNAVVLQAGIRLGPAELGVAASVGRAELRCAQKPARRRARHRRRAHRARRGARARRHLQLQRLRARRPGGAGGRRGGQARSPCRTTPRALGAALERGARRADVVIVSGGVSVGPHDHVKPALARPRRRGALLGRAAPPRQADLVRGRAGETLAFGLPGNPVSAMVTFQLFVRPGAGARSRARRPTRRASPRRSSARSRATRDASRPFGSVFVRLRTVQWPQPTKDAQGSHVLTSMLGADGLALIAPGEGERAGRRARGGRAPVRPRDPRRLLERHRRARARVTIVHEPQSHGSEDGGEHRQPPGGRGDAAAGGAREALVARAPREPRAHLLELPVALLARADPRPLHGRLARGGVPPPAVRPAALPQARVRPQSRTAARSRGRSTAACWSRGGAAGAASFG